MTRGGGLYDLGEPFAEHLGVLSISLLDQHGCLDHLEHLEGNNVVWKAVANPVMGRSHGAQGLGTVMETSTVTGLIKPGQCPRFGDASVSIIFQTLPTTLDPNRGLAHDASEGPDVDFGGDVSSSVTGVICMVARFRGTLSD